MYLRSLPVALRRSVLLDREPRRQPYRRDEDVWFRVHDRADLEALLMFVDRVLPGAIERFLDGQR